MVIPDDYYEKETISRFGYGRDAKMKTPDFASAEEKQANFHTNEKIIGEVILCR